MDNPEHVILSKELQGLLGDDIDTSFKEASDVLSVPHLIFNNKEYMFQVESIKKVADQEYTFAGLSTEFPVASFISGLTFDLQILGSLFKLDENQPIEYKSNGNLTFTARRIIKNEEVSI